MPLLNDLRERTPAMVDALRALVEAESPTADPGACLACAHVADALAADLLGTVRSGSSSTGARISAGGWADRRGCC